MNGDPFRRVLRLFSRTRISHPGLVTAAQALNALVSAIAILVTARALGTEGRGEFTVLQSVVALSVSFGLLGLPTYIVRSAQSGGAPKYRALVLTAATISGGVAGLVTAIVGSTGAEPLIGAYWPAIALAALAAVAQASVESLAARLQARQKFCALVTVRILCTTVPIASMAVAAYLTSNVIAAFGWGVLVTLVSLSLCQLTLAWGLRATTPADAIASPDGILALIRQSLSSHAALMLLLLVYRLDVLVLGLVAGPAAVGIYSVTYAAAEIAWLYTNGHSVTLMPQAVGTPTDRIERLLASASAAALKVALLICFIGAISGLPLIQSVLGEDYTESYWAFLVLIPGILAFVPFKLRATAIIATTNAFTLSRVCAIILGVNIAGTLMLAGTYGATGAAASSSLSYVIGWLLLLRTRP